MFSTAKEALKSILPELAIAALLATVICSAFILTGCGAEKASYETVELNKRIAKENSSALARKFLADNELVDLTHYNHGDSTISNRCPTGDGWSSVDLQDKNLKVKMQLKCSTHSMATACIPNHIFKSKASLTQEDDRCNADLPNPLPKLVN